MSKLAMHACSALLAVAAAARICAAAASTAPALPQIPAADYAITDFGAKPDGKTDSRPAIMQAIQKA